MYVKAKETFNYGGIIKMSKGECQIVSDELAIKLLKINVVEENKNTHKKIKFKKK
jgi:hypothetical protein